MARIETFKEEILPATILTGAFGEDVELLKCDTHESSHGEDEFASVVMFSSVLIQKEGKNEELHLVVKFNQESEIFRKCVLTDSQFQNEVFMYKDFFPFLKLQDDLPKCFYGVATGGKLPYSDAILLNDLCKENYHVIKDTLHLDKAHVSVALQKLARFHAASYIAKHNQEEVFADKIDQLKESQLVSEKFINLNVAIKPVVEKVVQSLMNNPKYVNVLEKFHDKFVDPLNYLKKLVLPTEPISVLCHGDFCKDNILFKCDKEEAPIDAKLVDFGTVRYSSPIIDLSFFLFFNTSSSVRRKYLDDFLTEYYNVLKSTVGDIQIPGIEAFEKEFFRKAIYGFLNCCLQMPITLTGPADWEELATLPLEKLTQYYSDRCNENTTALLTDILKDLVRFKCEL